MHGRRLRKCICTSLGALETSFLKRLWVSNLSCFFFKTFCRTWLCTNLMFLQVEKVAFQYLHRYRQGGRFVYAAGYH